MVNYKGYMVNRLGMVFKQDFYIECMETTGNKDNIISKIIDNKKISFCKHTTKLNDYEVKIIYTTPGKRSYIKIYKNNIPKKYNDIILELRKKHKEIFNTLDPYFDSNLIEEKIKANEKISTGYYDINGKEIFIGNKLQNTKSKFLDYCIRLKYNQIVRHAGGCFTILTDESAKECYII